MAYVNQKGLSTVNTVLREGKEVVFGIHVLVDQMIASLIRGPAFPITVFHETGVLRWERLVWCSFRWRS